MRVAIIGCGQLARMMALAGLPLGISFSFVDDRGNEGDTDGVDGLGIIASWQPGDCYQALYEQLGKPDVVTIDKEQVSLELLRGLSMFCTIRPGLSAVERTKNRLYERQLLQELGIPAAKHSFGEGLVCAARELGFPMMLKSIDDGYDGKNQWLIHSHEELDQFLQTHQAIEPKLLAEQFINFSRELSLIGVRATDDSISFYSLTENQHIKGVLHRSLAPAADISPDQLARARAYLERVMRALDYVGVMAMELFETPDGLLVNELAPRVHNSGHWTQTASMTCQFENHIRSITGLPLGSTAILGVAGMLNLIGNHEPPREALTSSSTLNWYNKQPKSGRKLGHANFLGASIDEVIKNMDAFEERAKLNPRGEII